MNVTLCMILLRYAQHTLPVFYEFLVYHSLPDSAELL